MKQEVDLRQVCVVPQLNSQHALRAVHVLYVLVVTTSASGGEAKKLCGGTS